MEIFECCLGWPFVDIRKLGDPSGSGRLREVREGGEDLSLAVGEGIEEITEDVF